MVTVRAWAAAIGVCAALAGAARAQDYPAKFLTIVVPFAAGSGSDTATRIMGQGLAAKLGQSVVVENKVGATGAIGATAVARAAPDGYTLLAGTNSSHGSNPALYKALTYDPIKDFTAVAPLGVFTYYLVVNPQLPAATPQELVVYAKAHPGKVSYAFGSTTALVMAETFARATGVQILKVAYRSNPPALTDVVSGRVSMMFVDVSSANAFVRSGQLRAIAVTSRERSSIAPDLPTIRETVAPDFAIESWTGYLVPARTPKPIVDRLNRDIGDVVNAPEVKARLAGLGVDVMRQTPEEFAGFVRNSVELFTRLAKEAGIEPE